MTVLVQQRTDHDCTICCMSMLTGRPYEEVIDVVGDDHDGLEEWRDLTVPLDTIYYPMQMPEGWPPETITDLMLYRAVIEAAQQVLVDYLEPDSGISAQRCIDQLLEILDDEDLVERLGRGIKNRDESSDPPSVDD